MHTSIIVSLTMLGLALGLPTNQTGTVEKSTLSPRSAVTAQNCGLTNYADFTEDPVRNGIRYLNGMGGARETAAGRSCRLVSCSYGTGISLCNDSPSAYSIGADVIAQEVQSLFSKCDPRGADGESENSYVHAMQAFYNDNHNVLVKGGYGC